MGKVTLGLVVAFGFLLTGPAGADQTHIFVSLDADELEQVKREHAVEHVSRAYFSKRGGKMGRISNQATESLRQAQKGDRFSLALGEDLSLELTVLDRRDAMGARYYTVSWPADPQYRLAETPDNPITPERERRFKKMHETLVGVFDWDYNRSTGEYVLAMNRPPMSGQGRPTGEEPIIAYLETHDLNTLSTIEATFNFPIENRKFEVASLQAEPSIHLITEVDMSRTSLFVRDEEETDAARAERLKYESALENARQTERSVLAEQLK
ncbi:MAG: hypothetical protein AAFR75_00025 [Pseudomonadota bacterium]